ncbi:MAG TPA: hypothetical protein DEG76_11520 [Pseudohongiella sp.]|nr:hypothetical protein [Pseudohongiella sp.]HBX37871.1 hypothetical protein [Pseudohongiella sp.]
MKQFSEGLGSSWVFTTILYFNDALTDAELAQWRPDQLKSRLRRQLHRADIKTPVLGSLELDFQSDIGRWLPHFHLLVLGQRSDVERMRGVILKKNKIPELGRAARPLFIKEVQDIDAAILYCHKFVWQDRRRFVVTPHGKPVHRTRKYRLDAARHALALQVLNRLGLPGLTFKSGVSRATHPDLSEYLSLANGKNHPKGG